MSAPKLLQRPIYGGVFGRTGRYALATVPAISNGLHSVRFMVVEAAAGAVLAIADDKVEVLSRARRVIRAANDLARKVEEQRTAQGALFPDEPLSAREISAPRSISRRRQEVFERSEGKCHYCSTPLKLDGKWHVEHMLPRALDGQDSGVNLVAACAPCNLAKRDRSAIEFMADGGACTSNVIAINGD